MALSSPWLEIIATVTAPGRVEAAAADALTRLLRTGRADVQVLRASTHGLARGRALECDGGKGQSNIVRQQKQACSANGLSNVIDAPIPKATA